MPPVKPSATRIPPTIQVMYATFDFPKLSAEREKGEG
jgi:hypothetical protein